MLIGFLVLSWLANILSLAVADAIFDGVHIGHWWSLLLGAAVLGIANTIVKPIVTLLALAEWISPNFSIDGFWTYVGATIVVWLLNWILHGAFGLREDSRFVRARARSTVFD